MALCPFAIIRKPLATSAGPFTGGPFKIVHHTTEGSTAAGAFAALASAHAESHFVVDGSAIYQLIDTSMASKSLRNASGGVQTNKDSAIQIEVVGFAAKPKSQPALILVRKLCRWIEQTHGVERRWPDGYPPLAYSPTLPRPAAVWDTQSGHYGHSQVPENTHWDPAYTKAEVDFIMSNDDGASPPVPMPPKPFLVKVVGLTAGDHLELRETPNQDGRDIGDLPLGLVLYGLSEVDNWTEVRTPYSGIHGWAGSHYLARL